MRRLLLPLLAVLAFATAGPASAATAERLLLFGDSLIAGYGLPAGQGFAPRLRAALRDAGETVEVIDAGVSGETSAGGRARVGWVLADKPTHVLLELGANDGLRGHDPADTAANLDAIVTQLKGAGVKVMLAGMRAPPNMGREFAEAFAAVYPALAEKHGIPLYPFFLDGVAADPALNQADGIHPNAVGVQRIVDRILPSLRAFLAGDVPS